MFVPLDLPRLPIGGNSHGKNLSRLTKQLVQLILRRIKRHIADKQRRRRLRNLIPKPGRSILGRIKRLLGPLLRYINIDGAAIHFLSLQFQGILGLFSGFKVDVAKALGTAGITVCDNASAYNAADGFEDAGEPVLVDVPGEIADENTCAAAASIGFGFDAFCRGRRWGGLFPFLGIDGFGRVLFFLFVVFFVVLFVVFFVVIVIVVFIFIFVIIVLFFGRFFFRARLFF